MKSRPMSKAKRICRRARRRFNPYSCPPLLDEALLRAGTLMNRKYAAVR